MIQGIYKIVNKINGKFYIGETFNIPERWVKHKRNLRKNRHHCAHLQNAWNKYGQDHFDFLIIEETVNLSKLELRSLEQKYFNLLNPSYNIIKDCRSQIERFANNPSWGGFELRANCLDCNKSISPTSLRCNHCARSGANNPNFGKPRSTETKKKISEHHKRIPKENHSFFGRTHSEDSKRKISESKIGQGGRRVFQIDLKTKLVIKEWESTSAAYKFLTGKSSSSNFIRHVCNKLKNAKGHLYKSAYGYGWQWASSITM